MVLPPASPSQLPEFRYGGARACHLMHREEIVLFVDAWRTAVDRGLADLLREKGIRSASYGAPDALLYHVLNYGRWYMVWIISNLGLSTRGLPLCPPVEAIASRADDYAEAMGSRWAMCLADVDPNRFTESYTVPWGVAYTVDSMLEHAVMHPKRHRLQLEEWLPMPTDAPS